MTEIKIVGPGLDPDDLWRNIFYLQDRIVTLEHKVAALHQAVFQLEAHGAGHRPAAVHRAAGGAREEGANGQASVDVVQAVEGKEAV